MKYFFVFLVSIWLCFLAGAMGNIFMMDSLSTWYPSLIKPEWNPPSWIFAPVWTTLYVLMGIALALVTLSASKYRKKAILLFIFHLVFNGSWSVIFFALQSPELALINIAFLWVLIAACVLLFWKICPLASILLWPYLAWVSFASYLNYTIVLLN